METVIVLTITGVLVGFCVVILIIAERSKRQLKKMMESWLAEMDEREVLLKKVLSEETNPLLAEQWRPMTRETHERLLELGKEED